MGQAFQKDSSNGQIKRMKGASDNNNNNVFCPGVKNPLCPQKEWIELPYDVVLEFYRLLPPNDRYSLSLTCKSWLKPFYEPSLWRQRNFQFNGWDDWKSVLFVSCLSKALRHVTVECSGVDTSKKRAAAVSLSDFFSTLVACKADSIVTLKISNILVLSSCKTTLDHVSGHLVSFLKMQAKLRLLCLRNLGLGEVRFKEIMSAVCRKRSCSFDMLEIIDPTPMTCYTFRYITGWKMFTNFMIRQNNLSELRINSDLLSDGLLDVLADSTNGKLKLITVWVFDGSLRSPVPSDQAWRKIVAKCPELRVKYVIVGCAIDNSPCFILNKYIPLTFLYWKTNNRVSQLAIQMSLVYIGDHLQNHLTALTLEFHSFSDSLQLIPRLIERCLQLESLSIKSAFPDVSSEILLIRGIRLALRNQPSSCLKQVRINGNSIGLNDTYVSYAICWLVDAIFDT